MGKIYIDNNNKIYESLGDLGVNLNKDIYVDSDDLEETIGKIIDSIFDMGIVQNLNKIGIYLDICYELDSTIYRD